MKEAHLPPTSRFRPYAAFVFLFVFICAARAQNFPGGFNFYLPHDDTSSTRFIPQFPRRPLAPTDFVSTYSGHFWAHGRPIRFFGMGFYHAACFPEEADAWFIAGRLRKFGFNMARFNVLDDSFGDYKYSLFRDSYSTRSLNPVTLRKVHKLMSELKKNGIYVWIPLFTYRKFTRQDGVPEADSLQYPTFGPAINYFDPHILVLNKEYARQLLTDLNPYTGKALAEDPVLGIVEIANEKSLYHNWRDNQLKPFSLGGILTARHTRMLDSLWNSYLKSRYLNSAGLARAWNRGYQPGVNQVLDHSFEDEPSLARWRLSVNPPARGSMSRDTLEKQSGSYSVKVVTDSVDGTEWHVALEQVGMSVGKDTNYIVRFAARADSTRPIWVTIAKEAPPYPLYYGERKLITPEWKYYTVYMRAPETADSVVRLGFSLGVQPGTYWIDDVSLTTAVGLAPGESLEQRSVRRIDYGECSAYTDQRVRDMSLFYFELQNKYYAQMYKYLRDTLHVRAPIVGSNINLGPPDLLVQSKMDFVDNHGYWDHPQFPGTPFSPTDWYIANTPMVRCEWGGTVTDLMAGSPVLGKPYTVGETNHFFPNLYLSEMPLFIAGYYSFHDADAVLINYYHELWGTWSTDWIENCYNVHRNSAIMSLIPSCAYAFRNGLIAKAKQTLHLNYSQDDVVLAPRPANQSSMGPFSFDRRFALIHAVRTQSFNNSVPFEDSVLGSPPKSPYIADTREIRWDVTGGLLSVAAGRFVGATGFLDHYIGQPIGPMRLKSASGFGTLTWISLTPDSLFKAERSLLTISTRTQNTDMIWEGDSTVHGNWGKPPTQIQPITLSLELRVKADFIRLYALDGRGRERNSFETVTPDPSGRFSFTIDQNCSRSMWFGVELCRGDFKR